MCVIAPLEFNKNDENHLAPSRPWVDVYVCAWSNIPLTHIYALRKRRQLIYLSVVSTPVCA